MGEFVNIDFTKKNAQPMDFQVDAQPINIYMKIRIDLRKNLQIPRNNLNRKNQKYKIGPNNKKTNNNIVVERIQRYMFRRRKIKKKIKNYCKINCYNSSRIIIQSLIKRLNELLDDVVKIEIRSHQRLQNQEIEEEKAQQLIIQRLEKEKKGNKKNEQNQKFMEKWYLDQLKNIKIMNSYQQRKNQMLKLKKGQKNYSEEIWYLLKQEIKNDQLKSSLRHVTQGDLLVKSEFNGCVRRGLIEPKSKSNKLSKAKVPLFKIKEK
ncbi:unnamed protein product [Paramecium primaurelia]|uniref:Uncharacterized protein n=1 Tax=Paramecium primaurelia TaxID=5886 RepID=A0A8S1JZX4_PARPR|nr:unnamed protein product [Paramecium primaurelia]